MMMKYKICGRNQEPKLIPAWWQQRHSLTAWNMAPPQNLKIPPGAPKMADGVWKVLDAPFIFRRISLLIRAAVP